MRKVSMGLNAGSDPLIVLLIDVLAYKSLPLHLKRAALLGSEFGRPGYSTAEVKSGKERRPISWFIFPPFPISLFC